MTPMENAALSASFPYEKILIPQLVPDRFNGRVVE